MGDAIRLGDAVGLGDAIDPVGEGGHGVSVKLVVMAREGGRLESLSDRIKLSKMKRPWTLTLMDLRTGMKPNSKMPKTVCQLAEGCWTPKADSNSG